MDSAASPGDPYRPPESDPKKQSRRQTGRHPRWIKAAVFVFLFAGLLTAFAVITMGWIALGP